MKRLWILFWVVIVLLPLSNAFAEGTLRLTTSEFAPSYSEKLKHFGLVPHIVTEAFALEGVKVEFTSFPWARAYSYVKSGKWDGSCCWFNKAERHAEAFHSEPVIFSTYVFFHLKNYEFDWKTLDDLKDIQIGGTIEYTYSKDFREAEEAGKILVERAPSDVINFRKLLRGRIDIFPQNTEVGFDNLLNNFTPEERELITFHPQPIVKQGVHLLLSKKDPKNEKMMELFNRGLKRLRDSGKIDQFVKASRRGEYKKN